MEKLKKENTSTKDDKLKNTKEDTLEKDEIKLLAPKIDVVFANLFSNKHPKITKSFVESLLKEKVENIVINEEQDLLREDPSDKLGVLDLQLDVDNQKKIDVEIQLANRSGFIKRMMYYGARMISAEMDKGMHYTKIKKVVSFAIVDFDIGTSEMVQKINGVDEGFRMTGIKNPKNHLTVTWELYIINLKKVKEQFKKNPKDPIFQWMVFLDDPNSEEAKIAMKENEEVKDATVVVRHMSEDEKMRRLAELRQKAIWDDIAIREQGYNDGHDAGKKEAEKETKEKMIKNLHSMGLSIDKIASAVEMSKSDVRKILEVKTEK